jgi:hypothetical protein
MNFMSPRGGSICIYKTSSIWMSPRWGSMKIDEILSIGISPLLGFCNGDKTE